MKSIKRQYVAIHVPLRVSLFGGGTDFKEYFSQKTDGFGVVLSTSISDYVQVTISSIYEKNLYKRDRVFVDFYGNKEYVPVEEISNPSIRECLKYFNVTGGLQIQITDTITTFLNHNLDRNNYQGYGLATSSAIVVGLVYGLLMLGYKQDSLPITIYQKLEISNNATIPKVYQYDNYHVLKEIATIAAYIELEKIGQSIGIQDQYQVSIGGLNQFKFYTDSKGNTIVENMNFGRFKDVSIGKESNLYVSTLAMDVLKKMVSSSFLLVYLGSPRNSTQILQVQKNSIDTNVEILDMMVHIEQVAFDAICSKMIILNHSKIAPINTYESSYDNNIPMLLGDNLDVSWELKKQLSPNISNKYIDTIYSTLKEHGMIGGKVLGAGGGGFLLVCAPKTRHSEIKKVLYEKFSLLTLQYEISDKSATCVYYKNEEVI